MTKPVAIRIAYSAWPASKKGPAKIRARASAWDDTGREYGRAFGEDETLSIMAIDAALRALWLDYPETKNLPLQTAGRVSGLLLDAPQLWTIRT